jgi:hypothetical protein
MMKTFSALVFFDTWDGARVGERGLRDEGYSTRMHVMSKTNTIPTRTR